MKKVVCLILVITILSAVALVSVNAFELQKYGDVDLNDEINIHDATLIQRYLIKSGELDETQKTLADVDGDGYINISDVTAIQKMLTKTDYCYHHEFCTLFGGETPEDAVKLNAEIGEKVLPNFTYFSGVGKKEYNLIRTYREYKSYFTRGENKLSSSYDEEFFKEYSLVFFATATGTGMDRFEFDSVAVKDNVLYLKTNEYIPEPDIPVTDDIGQYQFLIIVNKADVENVEKICLDNTVTIYGL